MKSKKILCCILASMIIASTTVGATLSVSAVNNDVIAVSDSITKENNITADYTSFIIGGSNNKQLIIRTNSTSENVSICLGEQEIASTKNNKQVTIQDGVVSVNLKVFHDVNELKQQLTFVFDDGTLSITVFNVAHGENTPYYAVMTDNNNPYMFGGMDMEKDEDTGLYCFEFTNNPPGEYTFSVYEWNNDNSFAVIKNNTQWSYQNDNENWVADAMVTYDESTGEVTATTAREYDSTEEEPIELSYFENWGYYIDNENVVISTYDGTETAEVTVPDTIEDKPVIEIKNNIFKDHSEIVSVTLPKTIYTIGESAFENCTSLVNVNLPTALDSVDSTAFKGCSSLTEINFPEKAETFFGISVFEDCTQLSSVTLPQKIHSISDEMFKNCRSLTDVNIPDSVMTIGSSAFENCKSLEKVNIPAKLEYLGMSAFKNCTALSGEITLTDIADISSYTFYGCRNLQKVTFTSSQKVVDDNSLTIDAMAFGNCKSLNEVDFLMTKSVTVKKTAFFNCSKVKTVRYTGGNDQWKENVKIELLGNLYFQRAMVYFDNMNYVELDKETLTVNNGDTVTLTYHSAPYGNMESDFKKITWQSSNPDVATVDKDGNVTAKKTGTTDIIVTSTTKSGYTHETKCTVTVVRPTESITLNKTAVNIGVSQKYTLKATVTPDDASKEIKWSSSDKEIATVNKDGVVTGKMTGTVTITAKTWDGKKVSCKVTVKKAPKEITLDKETLTLNVNSNYTFTKTTTPNSATSYKWTSSNPDVVRVYSTGKIVAQKSGTSVITVTTHNGKTANCTVTVK